MGLAAGAVAEFVDGGVGAAAAGFGGAVAGVGGGLALAAVIDHALDDGLAKAHDIIVVDGGSGCEEAVGKVHMGLAKEFDGKGDNVGSSTMTSSSSLFKAAAISTRGTF